MDHAVFQRRAASREADAIGTRVGEYFHPGDPGVGARGVDAVALVCEVAPAGDLSARCIEGKPMVAVVVHIEIDQARGVTARVDLDADVTVVRDIQALEQQVVAVGAARGKEPAIGAGQGQIRDGDPVGIVEADDRGAGIGVAAIEHRRRPVGGPLESHTRILGVDQHVRGQHIGAPVDIDHVPGVEVVGAQQGRQVGHGGVRGLARVGVVADGGGVGVVREVRIDRDVHVVGVARVGDLQRPVGGVGRRPGGLGGHPQQHLVAHRRRYRPVVVTAPVGVEGQTGIDQAPGRAAVGGDRQAGPGVGLARGVEGDDLDAREDRWNRGQVGEGHG